MRRVAAAAAGGLLVAYSTLLLDGVSHSRRITTQIPAAQFVVVWCVTRYGATAAAAGAASGAADDVNTQIFITDWIVAEGAL